MPAFLFAYWRPLAALLGAAIAALYCFHGGMKFERGKWQAAAAVMAERAIAVERKAAALTTDTEAAVLNAQRAAQEKADAELAALRAQLKAFPRCPVSVRTVRLLDGVPAADRAAPAAALAGAAAAPVAADAGNFAGAAGPAEPDQPPQRATDPGDAATVSAGVVLENCAWNRLNVAEPNARQLADLQAYYTRLRTLLKQP